MRARRRLLGVRNGIPSPFAPSSFWNSITRAIVVPVYPILHSTVYRSSIRGEQAGATEACRGRGQDTPRIGGNAACCKVNPGGSESLLTIARVIRPTRQDVL